MPQLITLGESMASFAPAAPGALRYVRDYSIRIAGAESNVAIGVAKLGIHAAWITRLGRDEFGQYILNQTRAEGVDCTGVVFDPDHRTGIMFKETGEGETRVFYYRENSAASHMCPTDLDPAQFAGAKILHLTGITPILSESCKQTVFAAMELAEQQGMKISFDPNIRRKLWLDRDFSPLIRQIALRSQIVLLGLEEAEAILGTREKDEICDRLFSRGHAEVVAIKDGSHGAFVASRKLRQPIEPYPCHCIEPIGAGDGFNAGLLAGLLQGRDLVTAGRMGAVCGALATQSPGDVEGYPDAEQLDAAMGVSHEIYR